MVIVTPNVRFLSVLFRSAITKVCTYIDLGHTMIWLIYMPKYSTVLIQCLKNSHFVYCVCLDMPGLIL